MVLNADDGNLLRLRSVNPEHARRTGFPVLKIGFPDAHAVFLGQHVDLVGLEPRMPRIGFEMLQSLTDLSIKILLVAVKLSRDGFLSELVNQRFGFAVKIDSEHTA